MVGLTCVAQLNRTNLPPVTAINSDDLLEPLSVSTMNWSNASIWDNQLMPAASARVNLSIDDTSNHRFNHTENYIMHKIIINQPSTVHSVLISNVLLSIDSTLLTISTSICAGNQCILWALPSPVPRPPSP